MMMLLAFIMFGAVLSTLLGTVSLVMALLFALVAICVVRPVVIGLVLRRANISPIGRAFIGWFGPRGLSSLLLALLVVQSGVPQSEWLLAIIGMVVLVSVVLHGVSATPLSAWYGRRVAAKTLLEERESSAVGLFRRDMSGTPRITPADLATLMEGPNPPIVIDVRTRSQYDDDPGQIPGSVRVLPDQVEAWAADQYRKRAVVAYCT
jgi:NhaP-type Na+/H+ or K+/H+ antiporter